MNKVIIDGKEYEIHADGVKEVREECPFCKEDSEDEKDKN